MALLSAALQVLLRPRGLRLPGAPEMRVPADPSETLLPALQEVEAAQTAARKELAVLNHQAVLLQAAQQAGHPKATAEALDRIAQRRSRLLQHLMALELQRDALESATAEASHARDLALQTQAPQALIPPGQTAPLGRRAARLLRDRQLQLLDAVLLEEQSTGTPQTALKDDLDLLDPLINRVETAPLAAGWPAMVECVERLEQLSAAIPRPSSDQGNGQEEHHKAPE